SCTRVATGITTHALYVTAGCAYSTTDRPTEIFVFAIDAETGQLALQTERTYRSASLFTGSRRSRAPSGATSTAPRRLASSTWSWTRAADHSRTSRAVRFHSPERNRASARSRCNDLQRAPSPQ